MKIIILFTILLSFNISFAQNFTKKDFKKIIREYKKEERQSGYSYDSRISTNNSDSIFFRSDTVTLFSSEVGIRRNEYCRTVQFDFKRWKKVRLVDCTICNGGSTCYITSEKNVYKYNLYEIDHDLFLSLKNKYNQMTYKIIDSKKTIVNGNEYFEIKLSKEK